MDSSRALNFVCGSRTKPLLSSMLALAFGSVALANCGVFARTANDDQREDKNHSLVRHLDDKSFTIGGFDSFFITSCSLSGEIVHSEVDAVEVPLVCGSNAVDGKHGTNAERNNNRDRIDDDCRIMI